MDLPRVGPVAESGQDCLCPTCLDAEIKELELSGPSAADEPTLSERPLVEGEDYYLEGAAMVFTARYLLRRGHCCDSGCRHCPYQNNQAP